MYIEAWHWLPIIQSYILMLSQLLVRCQKSTFRIDIWASKAIFESIKMQIQTLFLHRFWVSSIFIGKYRTFKIIKRSDVNIVPLLSRLTEKLAFRTNNLASKKMLQSIKMHIRTLFLCRYWVSSIFVEKYRTFKIKEIVQ